MHKAVELNMLEVIDIFFQHGADGTIQNKNGFTTLHIAAREGFTDMCKLLISKGIDEEIRDRYGFSASYWAM